MHITFATFLSLLTLLHIISYAPIAIAAANITDEEKKLIHESVLSEIKASATDWAKNFNFTIHEEVINYLKSKSLRDAFKQATGYKLETVVIIIVIVLTVPSLLVNILFFILQQTVKQGGKAICACTKCACKCGWCLTKHSCKCAYHCCCKRILCPCCCKDSPSAAPPPPQVTEKETIVYVKSSEDMDSRSTLIGDGKSKSKGRKGRKASLPRNVYPNMTNIR